MAWWNPWRELRAREHELTVARAERDNEREAYAAAQVVAATYRQANGKLIATSNELRARVAELERRCAVSHARDPKTGRLLDKGVWRGHKVEDQA